MAPVTALASALGIAWTSSVSLYATVAFTGLAGRLGWVALPEGLRVLESPWVIGVALALTLVEVAASLVPGIATAWEAAHAAIRPVAAAGLAVLATWGANPVLVAVAGLLGGSLGAVTTATKLKIRTAIDASPEPVSNAVATGAEVSTVAGMAWLVWSHPWVALALALVLLATLALLARAAWRSLRRAATWLSGG
ncbi:MAG TPA: DUF4126 domain-containing protein [Anaeromyxobacteraceae bacterium]|nr:DUF4126 domain-containing protein [Anaeromyxobacteraceae bacterium]